MNDDEATELLDRLVTDAPVGAAPTAHLVRAGRARRRRSWAAGLTAAAVAVTIGGIALLGGNDDPGGSTDLATNPLTPPSTEATPSDPAGTEPAEPGETLDVPARPGDPIYQQWTQRNQLASCGVIDPASMFRDVSREEQVAWTCLDRARDSGAGGEVAMSFSTIEGDPVRYWYRVLPTGRFEMYADATEDNFGSGKWEFADCAMPRILRRGCGG